MYNYILFQAVSKIFLFWILETSSKVSVPNYFFLSSFLTFLLCQVYDVPVWFCPSHNHIIDRMIADNLGILMFRMIGVNPRAPPPPLSSDNSPTNWQSTPAFLPSTARQNTLFGSIQISGISEKNTVLLYIIFGPLKERVLEDIAKNL